MRSRHPWWLPVVAELGAILVRALGATWRFTVSDAPEFTAALARGERFVYTLWHSGLLPLAVFHRHEGAAVLVSRHRDGELITRVIERLGFVAARGSSTRGGEAGVRSMLAWAGQGRHLGVTPDGPRGPAEQLKPGVLFIAERTGLRMVPVAAAARHTWALRSWDRFRVPWPFARVFVSHGAPFEPAAAPADAAFEPAAAPADAASGVPGSTPGPGAQGTLSLDEARAADMANEDATTECARRSFEGVLDALTRDVRTRAGERL